MSDIEIIKKYGSIENYIYELEQENKRLKEVIEEVREELIEIDDGIMETCKNYDVNGIKLKQILNKIKEN